MASYATVDDLKSLYLNMGFASTNNISTTKAQGALDDATALMNGYLGKVTTVPVTDSLDLPILKNICKKLAANDIDGILNTRQKTSGTDNQTKGKLRNLYEEAMKILEEIRSGDFYLNSSKNISRVAGPEADLELDAPDAYTYGDGTG